MESNMTEYKRSFGKEVIISLVAFANTNGGKVMVGVDDTGAVCGVEVGPETVQRYLNEIKVSTYPQLLPKGDFFRAKLRLPPTITPTITPTISDKRGGIHSGLENRMIILIKENARVSYTELAAKLSISRDTAIEYMSRLKKKGVVSRFGTTRDGYWHIHTTGDTHEHSGT